MHPAGAIVQLERGRNETARILAAARGSLGCSSLAAAANPRPQVDECLWKCFPEGTHQAVEDCGRASELRWGFPLLQLSWPEASAVTRVIAGVLGAGVVVVVVLSQSTVKRRLGSISPPTTQLSPLPFVSLAFSTPTPSPVCSEPCVLLWGLIVYLNVILIGECSLLFVVITRDTLALPSQFCAQHKQFWKFKCKKHDKAIWGCRGKWTFKPKITISFRLLGLWVVWRGILTHKGLGAGRRGWLNNNKKKPVQTSSANFVFLSTMVSGQVLYLYVWYSWDGNRLDAFKVGGSWQ